MRISWALLIIIMLFSASSIPAQNFPGVTIKSNPEGALAQLKGEYDMSAITPFSLSAGIIGDFKMKVTKPGYETWKGDIDLPTPGNLFEINLNKRSRAKAGLRSFIIPGWGQLYSERKFNGFSFMILEAAAGASFIIAKTRFDNRKTDYDLALDSYHNAQTPEETANLQLILDESQNDMDDAESIKNTVLAVGVGIWAYNLIDALMFFPKYNPVYPTVTSLDNGLALKMNIRF